MEIIDSASSLWAQDPSRHYGCFDSEPENDPQLRAKRVTVGDFILKARALAKPSFRYLAPLTGGRLIQTSAGLKRFMAKLRQGSIDDYADSLRNQTLSAEAIFLDLVTRGPEGQNQYSQIQSVVKAECDEAHLRARQDNKPYGQRMLIDVQDRLRKTATEESDKVAEQPYEALMGMVGLLTEDCPVWWSEKFPLEQQT
jgi:hypothetical protein